MQSLREEQLSIRVSLETSLKEMQSALLETSKRYDSIVRNLVSTRVSHSRKKCLRKATSLVLTHKHL